MWNPTDFLPAKRSYYAGRYFNHFKILIVVESADSDFEALKEASPVQPILWSFRMAAKELETASEAFDEVCSVSDITFDTYTMGMQRNNFFDVYDDFTPGANLLVICENPNKFEDFLGYIHDRLVKDNELRFPLRKVVLLTDKRIPETFSRYQKTFRRFKQRGVEFDFWLVVDGGAVKIPVLQR